MVCSVPQIKMDESSLLPWHLHTTLHCQGGGSCNLKRKRDVNQLQGQEHPIRLERGHLQRCRKRFHLQGLKKHTWPMLASGYTLQLACTVTTYVYIQSCQEFCEDAS